MKFGDTTRALLLRPKALHKLPGRIRVHMPLLKRLPLDSLAAAQATARLLSAPDGIDEAVPSVKTGNVLVRYDAGRVSEEDVLRYLRSVTEIFVANRDRLTGLDAERLRAAEDRIRDWLTQNITYRLELRGDLRIPDEVLD
jgi:hypothetical protein